MKHIILLTSLTCTLLAGCVSQYDEMRSKGYSQAYAQGYEDGCHSGNQAAGSYLDTYTKNDAQFRKEPDYADAWRDGFNICQANMQRTIKDAEKATKKQPHDKRQDDYYRKMEQEAIRDIDTSGLSGY